LLAPILRNRVRLLLDPSSHDDSWLSLLTWSGRNGSALVTHVESIKITPHPSSGEVELGCASLRGVCRVDAETLKATFELLDYGLVVVYTWCENDPDGEDDGWRVLDVHTAVSADDTHWFPTVKAAEEAFTEAQNKRTLTDLNTPESASSQNANPARSEDEDDYWNLYDRSAAATPAVGEPGHAPTEKAYFDRYSEVEPMLDSSKYAETEMYLRDSAPMPALYSSDTATSVSTPPTAISSSFPIAPPPKSNESDSVPATAQLESSTSHMVQTEVAVKQHISTTIKSLYRLSKAAGMGRDEFESLIQTEIAVLSMLDADDT